MQETIAAAGARHGHARPSPHARAGPRRRREGSARAPAAAVAPREARRRRPRRRSWAACRHGGAGGGARRGAAPKVVCRGARCCSAGGSPPPPSPSQLGRLPPRLPRERGAAPGAARGEEQRQRWCAEGPAAHAIMPDSRAARAGQWRTRRVRADKGPVRDARGRVSAAGRAEHLIRVQMSRPRRSRHSK